MDGADGIESDALQVGGHPVAAVISPTHLRVKQSLVNLEVAGRLYFGSIWVQSEILRFFRSLRAYRAYRAAVLLKARAELPSEQELCLGWRSLVQIRPLQPSEDARRQPGVFGPNLVQAPTNPRCRPLRSTSCRHPRQETSESLLRGAGVQPSRPRYAHLALLGRDSDANQIVNLDRSSHSPMSRCRGRKTPSLFIL